MSKRSNFPRIAKDAYQTIDPRAVAALVPHLRAEGIKTFAEPCCGEGYLVRQLQAAGFDCEWESDIDAGIDANFLGGWHVSRADAIITNPPWSRPILHDLIIHFQNLAPTWLLFDAD
jgi:hypothetical protein